MDILFLLGCLIVLLHWMKSRDERVRVGLLARHLGQYEIEKLMATIADGYARALGETDMNRQAQIWSILEGAENSLCDQFRRFALDFSQLKPESTRASKLPFSVFFTEKIAPEDCFDMRALFMLHAQSLCQAVSVRGGDRAKERAFTILAEMYLMQHSCHWFCKSKAVASARLIMLHQTPYAKVIDSIAPQTRAEYLKLTTR